MKTNKLKNYIKLGIVLFSISLLFTNCQNELEEKNEIQNNEQKHKIELHSKSQIANNVNVISKIKKLNTNIKNKKETKSVYSDLYDFTIETDYALYAEFEDGTYSYTFPISRETSTDGIENFVLTLTLDGNLRAQYFKYDLTHEEYLNYGTDPSLLDKVTIITVEDNDLILEVNQVKYDGGDSGWSWESVGGYWNESAYTFQRRQEWITVFGWVYHGSTDITDFDPCYNCDAGAGADDDGYNPSYEGGPSSGNNSTVTTPFSFVELQFLIDLGNALGGSGSAFSGLTSEQNAWVTDNINNYQQAQKIRDFLNLNPNSQIFANELLNISMLGNPAIDINQIMDSSIISEDFDECRHNLITRSFITKDFLENTAFGEKILNTFIKNPNTHISFRPVTDQNNTTSAKTNWVKAPIIINGINGSAVTIEMNDNYLNQANDIAIVTTIFHEILHAYIVELYYSGNLLSICPEYTELNDAFNAFVNDANYPNTENINQTIKDNLDDKMHDIYDDYIEDLATSIHNYAIKNNIKINNSIISLDYARNLIWGSLQNENVSSNNPTQAQASNIFNNNVLNNSNSTQTKSCN